jgi:hypothetical protein
MTFAFAGPARRPKAACQPDQELPVDAPNDAYANGPLPQWTQLGGYGSGTFEAPDPTGVMWRLWAVDDPAPGDPFPRGYRLAPRDDLDNINFVTGEHGLYHALDTAGMRIAGDAIRLDPDGARRQLGLTEERPDSPE